MLNAEYAQPNINGDMEWSHFPSGTTNHFWTINNTANHIRKYSGWIVQYFTSFFQNQHRARPNLDWYLLKLFLCSNEIKLTSCPFCFFESFYTKQQNKVTSPICRNTYKHCRDRETQCFKCLQLLWCKRCQPTLSINFKIVNSFSLRSVPSARVT